MSAKLTEDEYQHGEYLLLRSIQRQCYTVEYKLLCSNVKTKQFINQLDLFLAEDLLIRSKVFDYSIKYDAHFTSFLVHILINFVIRIIYCICLHWNLKRTNDYQYQTKL